MLLTVSKRLEFSASRRLFVPDWSDQENLIAFGPETRARYGTGRNYVAYFVFTGPVNPTTGMLINISKIKERAGEVVAKKFDHKFLNDLAPFDVINPSAENMAKFFYDETSRQIGPALHGPRITSITVWETDETSATYTP